MEEGGVVVDGEVPGSSHDHRPGTCQGREEDDEEDNMGMESDSETQDSDIELADRLTPVSSTGK